MCILIFNTGRSPRSKSLYVEVVKLYCYHLNFKNNIFFTTVRVWKKKCDVFHAVYKYRFCWLQGIRNAGLSSPSKSRLVFTWKCGESKVGKFMSKNQRVIKRSEKVVYAIHRSHDARRQGCKHRDWRMPVSIQRSSLELFNCWRLNCIWTNPFDT